MNISKRMTSTLAAGAILAIGATSFIGCGGKSSLPEGQAASVGGAPITQADLSRSVERIMGTASVGATMPKPGTKEYLNLEREAMASLVTMKRIALQAKECGAPCATTDAAVEAKKADVIAKDFGGKNARFNEFVKRSKISPEELEALLTLTIQSEAIQKNATAGISYTKEQAKAFYEKNKAMFEHAAHRNVSHILLKSKAKATEVALMANSSNFAELAKKYSADTGSAKSGGAVGELKKGAFVPPFEKAATNAKPGVVTGPIKTQFGWHLIIASDVPAETMSYETAEKAIIQRQIMTQKESALGKLQASAEKKWPVTYASSDLAPELPQSTQGQVRTAG